MPTLATNVVLEQIRPRLTEVFRDRLRGVVLFGSEARGDAEPDSDIDVLVLLEGPIDLGEDIRVIVDALYPLQMQLLDRPLHALPADVKDFEAERLAFYRHVKSEGVFL
jgi:predicted nucleotidyltransferase